MKFEQVLGTLLPLKQKKIVFISAVVIKFELA